jgi:hypothetical protein
LEIEVDIRGKSAADWRAGSAMPVSSGIAGGVATFRAGCLLEFEFKNAAMFGLTLHRPPFRRQGATMASNTFVVSVGDINFDRSLSGRPM